MAKKFKMSMMGELSFSLGLQVKQLTDGIFFQAKYIANMLKNYGFSDWKLVKTSMFSSTSIVTDVNATLFRGMICSLLYLTAIRPDIMSTTILCSHYQSSPKESHLHAIKWIFWYLKHTPYLGLWCPHDSEFKIEGYTDSDHGGCGIDHKIMSGEAQMLGNRLVS